LRAVLPNAPTLLLESSVQLRHLKRVFRPLVPLLLIGIEAGEVAADDFLRGIALELLGAGVPTGDLTGRIERKNRVIGNAVEQQVVKFGILPLALPARWDIAHQPFSMKRCHKGRKTSTG